MRLRLAVRRHGLPDANILWSSNGLHAIPQAHGSDLTIAEFLVQVNEVIPLESEDWGLEDYVVEVGGFECVHFSTLGSVFKEEDKVVIRPLQLNDRRFRRVSGRVQIAADGRRLYDGVAFGRPFVRKFHRPPVRIPSIKRAKITYDDHDDDILIAPNQLILRDEDIDEDDLDYDEDLSPQEIADLAAETVRTEHEDQRVIQDDLRFNPRKRRKTGLGIEDVRVSPSSAFQDSSFGSRSQQQRNHRIERGNIRGSPKNVRFDTDELETPATILDMDETDEEDEDFISDDNDTDDSEANKENIAPVRSLRSNVIRKASATANESSSASEFESSESTSSSGSDSESDDCSEDKSADTTSTTSSESSEDTSSSGESTSRSRSEAVSSPKTNGSSLKGFESALEVLERQTASGEQKILQTSIKESYHAAPPGQGLKTTKKRNARRKLKKQFNRIKVLESQARSISDSSILHTTNQTTKELGEISDAWHDLDVRKAALLQHLNPQDSDDLRDAQEPHPAEEDTIIAGLDVSITMVSDQQGVTGSSPVAKLPSSVIQPKESESLVQDEAEQNVASRERSLQPISPESEPKQAQLESQKPSPKRSRLDLGSAKRMLFGSLGLRAPKSKDDADILRNKMEEKAQKLPGNMIGPVKPSQPEPVPAVHQFDESYDSWRDHIDLQAVECCYDNVEYSIPPFPFVQRWDPQQHYDMKRKGKGRGGRSKRQKRNNKQYYQEFEDEAYQGYNDSFADQSYQNQAETSEEQIDEIGHDTSMQTYQDTQAANEQLLGESQAQPATVCEIEFPSLPKDMSALPILTRENALSCNIIAFKQMEMSEHTGWCPIISKYRTAVVESVLDDGVLAVRLAAKDVPQTEKNYDPETGERIYAKFEMPDEEEEDEQDSRYQEIGLQDMIDPRLVKQVDNADDRLEVSAILGSAIQSVKGIITTGKQLLGDVLPRMESTEVINAEVDAQSVLPSSTQDIEYHETNVHDPTRQSDVPSDVSNSSTEKTSRLGEDSGHQQDIDRTSSLEIPAREVSVELGSDNPPRRRFSELQSSPELQNIHHGKSDIVDQEDKRHTSLAENDISISVSRDGPVDDPSLWHYGSEINHEEQEATQYFSPLPDSNPLSVSSPQNEKSSDIAIIVKNIIPTSAAPNDSIEPVDRANDVVQKLDLNDEDVDEVEDFQDNDDEDEIDRTLTQNSAKFERKASKDIYTNGFADGNQDEDSNSDSGSSSLPSLKDLLSQPITSPANSIEVKHRKGEKNGYLKISSTAPEIADSFVSSQAPKRLISDTHKIAIAIGDECLRDGSDKESLAGPYELEGHTDSNIDVMSERDEPSLPELPVFEPESKFKIRATRETLFVRPPFKRPAASQPSNAKKSVSVVDLTLSSDPIEPEDEDTPKRKQPSRRFASSMPSGPGWVGKGSLKEGETVKSKTPRRSLKRTKSLV